MTSDSHVTAVSGLDSAFVQLLLSMIIIMRQPSLEVTVTLSKFQVGHGLPD